MHMPSCARIHPFQEYGAHGTGAFCLFHHFHCCVAQYFFNIANLFSGIFISCFFGTYIFIEVFSYVRNSKLGSENIFHDPETIPFRLWGCHPTPRRVERDSRNRSLHPTSKWTTYSSSPREGIIASTSSATSASCVPSLSLRCVPCVGVPGNLPNACFVSPTDLILDVA